MSAPHKKRRRLFHISREATFGDGVTHTDDTAQEALEGSSIHFQKFTEHENTADNFSRDANDMIKGRREPFDCTLETHLRLPTGPGVAARSEEIILAALGAAAARVTPAGEVVGAGSTTSLIKVVSAGEFQFFDIVRIDGMAAAVVGIDETPADEGITIDPPLLAAPTEGAAINVTRTLHCADEHPSCALDGRTDRMTKRNSGGVITSLAFNISGNEPVKMQVNLQMSAQIVTATGALAQAVADGGALSFVVTDVSPFRVGSLLDLDAETGAIVTAINETTKTLTVSRGANASAHDAGTVITPTFHMYEVTEPIAHGAAGRSRRGQTADGAAVAIPATARTITIETGATLQNDEDGYDDVAVAGPSAVTDGMRRVSGNRTIHLRDSALKWLSEAEGIAYQSEIYEVTGKTGGMVIYMPRVPLKIPTEAVNGEIRDLQQDFTAARPVDGNGVYINNRPIVIAFWGE